MEEFGVRLKSLLEERNINAVKLAESIGVTKNTIYNIFKGASPKLDTLNDIAKVLDVSLDFLVFGDEEYRDAIEEELLSLFRELNHKDKVEVVSNITALVTRQRLMKTMQED